MFSSIMPKDYIKILNKKKLTKTTLWEEISFWYGFYSTY